MNTDFDPDHIWLAQFPLVLGHMLVMLHACIDGLREICVQINWVSKLFTQDSTDILSCGIASHLVPPLAAQ